MNCAFHSQNAASVNCNGCGRPLCAGCDHRIKGFPYCEDCIVEGVAILRSSDRVRFSAGQRKKTFPIVALFLSWVCPGLGAGYNGQMVKALVHFGIVAVLFQMAVSTKMAIFIMGFLAMWWFFLPLDAWRSAKMIRLGIRPEEAEDLILERLTGNAKVTALVLVGIGGLFFVTTFLEEGKAVVKTLLPFVLVVLGVYVLRDYAVGRRRSRERAVSASFGEISRPEDRFKDGPPKSSWRN